MHNGKHTKNGPLELFQKKTVRIQISKIIKEVIFPKKVFSSKLNKLRNPKVVIIIANTKGLWVPICKRSKTRDLDASVCPIKINCGFITKIKIARENVR